MNIASAFEAESEIPCLFRGVRGVGAGRPHPALSINWHSLAEHPSHTLLRLPMFQEDEAPFSAPSAKRRGHIGVDSVGF